MKTNKLLSYITLGVLFSGVAFADGGDFILMDGAETQSPAASKSSDISDAGDRKSSWFRFGTADEGDERVEDKRVPKVADEGRSANRFADERRVESSDVPDAGVGESNGIRWGKSKDQGTTGGDLARRGFAETDKSSGVSDASVGESNGIRWKSKDQGTTGGDLARRGFAETDKSSGVSDASDRRWGQSTDQGTTDSAQPLRDTGAAEQDRASPEEVVVTGSKK